MQAQILKPKDFEPSKKYPVILNDYVGSLHENAFDQSGGVREDVTGQNRERSPRSFAPGSQHLRL